jgi:hypothetical protein
MIAVLMAVLTPLTAQGAVPIQDPDDVTCSWGRSMPTCGARDG